MPTDSDYVIFFAVLLAVLGAGLLRVGLMNPKSEPPEVHLNRPDFLFPDFQQFIFGLS